MVPEAHRLFPSLARHPSRTCSHTVSSSESKHASTQQVVGGKVSRYRMTGDVRSLGATDVNTSVMGCGRGNSSQSDRDHTTACVLSKPEADERGAPCQPSSGPSPRAPSGTLRTTAVGRCAHVPLCSRPACCCVTSRLVLFISLIVIKFGRKTEIPQSGSAALKVVWNSSRTARKKQRFCAKIKAPKRHLVDLGGFSVKTTVGDNQEM